MSFLSFIFLFVVGCDTHSYLYTHTYRSSSSDDSTQGHSSKNNDMSGDLP